MRGKWLVFYCILLAIMNIAWVWRYQRKTSEYREREVLIREKLYLFRKENDQLRSALATSVAIDFSRLPDQLKVKTGDARSLKLTEEIGSSEKLFLYLTDNHCSSCIDEVLFFLKRNAGNFGPNAVKVLYRRSGSTESRWKQRSMITPGITFLELEQEEGALQLDLSDYPCFFVTGQNLLTGKTHVFLPQEHKQNEKYLSMIARRFQEAKNHEIN